MIDLILNSKPYQYAIAQNVYLWFHMLAGALAGLLGNHLHEVWRYINTKTIQNMPMWVFRLCVTRKTKLYICLTVATAWEVYEGYTGLSNYPNKEQFIWDAIGDVVGEMLMASMVMR